MGLRGEAPNPTAMSEANGGKERSSSCNAKHCPILHQLRWCRRASPERSEDRSVAPWRSPTGLRGESPLAEGNYRARRPQPRPGEAWPRLGPGLKPRLGEAQWTWRSQVVGSTEGRSPSVEALGRSERSEQATELSILLTAGEARRGLRSKPWVQGEALVGLRGEAPH